MGEGVIVVVEVDVFAYKCIKLNAAGQGGPTVYVAQHSDSVYCRVSHVPGRKRHCLP